MGLGSGFPVGAWAGLAPRPVFLRPYTSHYRNRESLVRRQAAERHLEDGGIYGKRWWTTLYRRNLFATATVFGGRGEITVTRGRGRRKAWSMVTACLAPCQH